MKSCEIFLLLKIRTMATKFSPCKGSYVLNQFPSNVMFGMNGFHISASGAIQVHHGPLVPLLMGVGCLPITLKKKNPGIFIIKSIFAYKNLFMVEWLSNKVWPFFTVFVLVNIISQKVSSRFLSNFTQKFPNKIDMCILWFCYSWMIFQWLVASWWNFHGSLCNEDQLHG